MAYIDPGDRIVPVIPDEDRDGKLREDVSGIVALAEDIGRGDWLVLIWYGRGEPGRMRFKMEPVNILNIDVVESHCALPPLPQVLVDGFPRWVQGAKDEAAKLPAFPEDAVIERMRGCLPDLRSQFPREVLADIGSKCGDVTDDQMRVAIQRFMVRTFRDAPTLTMSEKQMFVAASQTKIDELVAEIRRHVPLSAAGEPKAATNKENHHE